MKERLVILGAGESGTGSAILAARQGYEVFVSDNGIIKDRYRKDLKAYNIDFEEGKHDTSRLLQADLVVKSPGIPDGKSPVSELVNEGIKVISEIEFAGRFTDAKKICITGSNGKTTTTNLIYEILKKACFNVGLAGNVGNSFARQVANSQYDYYVIELSSFQLDVIFFFGKSA